MNLRKSHFEHAEMLEGIWDDMLDFRLPIQTSSFIIIERVVTHLVERCVSLEAIREKPIVPTGIHTGIVCPDGTDIEVYHVWYQHKNSEVEHGSESCVTDLGETMELARQRMVDGELRATAECWYGGTLDRPWHKGKRKLWSNGRFQVNLLPSDTPETIAREVGRIAAAIFLVTHITEHDVEYQRLVGKSERDYNEQWVTG